MFPAALLRALLAALLRALLAALLRLLLAALLRLLLAALLRLLLAALLRLFLAAFVLAGFNWRFGWIPLPKAVSYIAAVVFLLAYALYAQVLRENEYLSRTIEVQENQRVIDTGLYGVVRHPMYMSTVFLFLSMPLVLGSLISFIIMLIYIPVIQRRMKNEEEVLKRELKGYDEYMEKVKYRVIPFIW